MSGVHGGGAADRPWLIGPSSVTPSSVWPITGWHGSPHSVEPPISPWVIADPPWPRLTVDVPAPGADPARLAAQPQASHR
ncbi:MAG: hypothetical protein KGJ57_10715 [Sphingomonadales bacterium]|nr:hypothetical protein [Sphingomonadales bacterium]MDE2169886.1 hypothetical protein [Sphingomonadales bacterium]